MGHSLLPLFFYFKVITLLVNFFRLELLELFCSFTDSPCWISHQPWSRGYFNIEREHEVQI